MRIEKQLMVSVLAKTDACFDPPRCRKDRPQAIQKFREAREACESFGVAAHASRQIEGRDKNRLLDELVSRGDLLRLQKGGNRAVGYLLADAFDWMLRPSIACLCGLRETLDVMRRMSEFFDSGEAAGDLADESEFVVRQPNESFEAAAEGFTWSLGGALRRGWVRARSNTIGRLWWGLTEEGRAILADPPDDGLRSDYDTEAGDFYLEVFMREIRRIEGAPVRNPQELGELPLPAGIDWMTPAARERQSAEGADR